MHILPGKEHQVNPQKNEMAWHEEPTRQRGPDIRAFKQGQNQRWSGSRASMADSKVEVPVASNLPSSDGITSPQA